MTGYGSATVILEDGRPVVLRADDVIGMTEELFAELDREPDGTLLLAGDPEYRYRLVGPAPGERGVLVLERVRAEGVG